MDKIKTIIILILEQVVGLLFIVIVAATLAQVFCRYALGFSLTWSHELVILLLIWAVWLCMPIGLDRMEHISVTFLVDHVSDSLRARLVWCHWALSLFFFGMVFFLSFPVVKAFEGMELFSIPIPTNARYYAATAGSLLAGFVLAAKLFQPRKGT